jgi:glucose-1-phosphate thymidylyltransferase
MMERKGIILAGGSGTRLYPLTMAVSKHLLAIYDKPMIYYPLTILMQANIREILIITTPRDQEQFKDLLGDGSKWGIQLEYKTQARPDGLAQAFILADDFLNGAPSAMILGDNIFFGHGLPEMLKSANEKIDKSTIFGYHVSDPERYGVLGFEQDGSVKSIIEKPDVPQSNYAVTGLYFLDNKAPSRARDIKPSARGELEITSLLEIYLKDGNLDVERMGNGYAWLDTGTHSSLLDASNFVRTLIERQGLQVGSPDEIAYKLQWITKAQLAKNAKFFGKNNYGHYLENL